MNFRPDAFCRSITQIKNRPILVTDPVRFGYQFGVDRLLKDHSGSQGIS